MPRTLLRGDLRRVVLSTLTLAGVAGAFGLLYVLRGALFLSFGAIVIGVAARPSMQRLHRAGLPRPVAASLLYLALLGGGAAIGILLLPLVAEELALLAARLPSALSALELWLSGVHNPVGARLAIRVGALLSSSPMNARAEPLVSSAMALVGALGHVWITCLLVVVLSFFWMLDGAVAVRSLLRFMALDSRPAAVVLVETAESRVGAFVRAQLFMSLITATVLSVAYLVIGLPYALVLGVIGGVLQIVPFLGPLVGVLPALLIAVSVSPVSAVWVAAAVLGNQLIQGYVVGPRILGRAVGVRPLVALLSISVFGSLLGIAGAVLAIPIAAILQLVLDQWLLAPARSREPARRDHGARLSLRARDVVSDVRKLVRRKSGAPGDEVEDAIESIADDVERLLVAPAGAGP